MIKYSYLALATCATAFPYKEYLTSGVMKSDTFEKGQQFHEIEEDAAFGMTLEDDGPGYTTDFDDRYKNV